MGKTTIAEYRARLNEAEISYMMQKPGSTDYKKKYASWLWLFRHWHKEVVEPKIKADLDRIDYLANKYWKKKPK